MLRFVFTLILAVVAVPVHAQGLAPVEIVQNVYALVGPLSQRDPDNLGNNATFGLVVTNEGAVVIDAGGSYRGAEALHTAVRQLTDAPVVKVINTGGQDHRWIGNSYWAEQGAEIIASNAAVADQQARASMQMTALATLIGADGLAGTDPRSADLTFEDRYSFNLGGVDFELIHGPAHTPGEALVWLPAQEVVFTGDLVYVERMLGVMSFSSSRAWVASFEAMEALAPAHVVPGHGHPTDLATAKRDTYDYLVALRAAIGDLIGAGGDIIDAPTVDQAAYSYLANFEALAGRNAQQVYSQMEWE